MIPKLFKAQRHHLERKANSHKEDLMLLSTIRAQIVDFRIPSKLHSTFPTQEQDMRKKHCCSGYISTTIYTIPIINIYKQADEYKACDELSYAEMMALPDYPISQSDLENDESDSASTDKAITPCPRPSLSTLLSSSTTPTINRNININYSHTYSITKKNGEELDFNALLNGFAQHTTIPSAGTITTTTKASTEEINDTWKHKKRRLMMDNASKPLIFDALDISDPPYLKYSDNMDELILDWDDSSHLIVKGMPIPLKYWSRVFRWAKPEAWNLLKDNWSNWKVISSLFSSYLGIYESS